MANTYYDSELTAEEIEEVLEAINGILNPANNGKVLAISNGKIEARSVQWGGGEAVLEPLSVTANGDYYPEAGVDGFDEVHVAVPSSSPTIQSLSITRNGTYTAPSGVDGYSPIVVNVSGGGANTVKLSVGSSSAVVNAADEYVSGATNDSYFMPRNSDNSYAKLDLSSPFEICCKFKLTQSAGQYSRLAFGSQNDWYYSPAIGIRPNNAGFCFNFAKQGSSGWQYDQYDFTSSGYSGVPLDTWITEKVTFDGTNTTFYATDGTVEASYTVENSAPRYSSSYNFEFGGQNRSQYSICSVGAIIDLDGTYLKQGNTVIWGYES